MKIAIIWASF